MEQNDLCSFINYCGETLDIEDLRLPEEYYYQNMVDCVLDAVYSIGVKYASVKRVVSRYHEKISAEGSHKLSDFIQIVENMGIEDFTNNILENCQRTSSTNGILKSEACYHVAQVLVKHGIDTKQDFQNFSGDRKKLDSDIKNVKGQSSGIMLKYLYMLAGNDDVCKPDRHIHRFIKSAIGKNIGDDEIQILLTEACAKLKNKYPELTVRLLDYAIWNYQRTIKNQ